MENIIKESVKNKICRKIRSRGRGWVFSAVDFKDKFNRREIDESLSYLSKDKIIRRIIRGVYDYPEFSKLLNKYVSPDICKIAYALARKFSWRIHPEGNTALNYLGLSNQVAAKNIYLSDGPNRKYNIKSSTLEFKHTAMKESALKRQSASLTVQALKSWGENNITDELIEKLSSKYSLQEWIKIKNDTIKTTGWIYKVINEIILSLENKNG
jgi:hypothetical protein